MSHEFIGARETFGKNKKPRKNAKFVRKKKQKL